MSQKQTKESEFVKSGSWKSIFWEGTWRAFLTWCISLFFCEGLWDALVMQERCETEWLNWKANQLKVLIEPLNLCFQKKKKNGVPVTPTNCLSLTLLQLWHSLSLPCAKQRNGLCGAQWSQRKWVFRVWPRAWAGESEVRVGTCFLPALLLLSGGGRVSSGLDGARTASPETEPVWVQDGSVVRVEVGLGLKTAF